MGHAPHVDRPIRWLASARWDVGGNRRRLWEDPKGGTITLRKSARLLVVLALLFGTIVATAATGVAGPDSDRPAVRLKAAEFSPDGTTTAQGAVNARGRGYYIVQYGGPILQEQADALRRAGAEIMAYVPDFAYKVRMRPSTVGAVSGLAGVTWVGTFEADYKLSPDLAADGLYWVRTERGIDHAAVAAAIEAAGARIVSGNGDVLAIQADRATLDAVAAIADVAWVQNLVWREKHNEYGAGVIVGANTANAVWLRRLDADRRRRRHRARQRHRGGSPSRHPG